MNKIKHIFTVLFRNTNPRFNAVFIALILLLMGIGIGLISMYFGASAFTSKMFLSYFKVGLLPLLNLLPVVGLSFLFYFIFNRIWASFLATSIIAIGSSWVNYFKLMFRNDPLLAVDLTLLNELRDMSGKYHVRLNWKFYIVMVLCVLVCAMSVFLFRHKIPKIRHRLAGIAATLFLAFLAYTFVYANGDVYAATDNPNVPNRWSGTQIYISKGFVYPFIYSIKTSLDHKPEGYDEAEVLQLLNSYDYGDIPDDKKVNVVGVMLEAYNDFSKFDKIQFNIDVYEYLHELQAESYSGELVTNIFAGGTINTERNFLTGFSSLVNFRKDVPTYVRYFKEQGYTVEGSHPCYEWFYNRKNINTYLGFDNYYFYENRYAALADNTIAKDSILFPEIIKLYEENQTTDKPYFSFNITYQNHGPYPTEKKKDKQYVVNAGYSEAEYNIMNNYFSGIYDTNQQLEKMIDYFRSVDEPVVVILFGDHNPWMGDNNSVYKMLGINFDFATDEGFYNYYDTPYLIWANEPAKATLDNDFVGKGPKIGPYFLMNEFFNLAGYTGNAYMQYANEVKSTLDLVHITDRYQVDGKLTPLLDPDTKQLLNQYKQVQYYMRNDAPADRID